MLLLALACIENGLNEPGQEIEEPLRELVVAPAGLDFGEVELGAERTMVFTISSVGNAPVALDELTVTGPSSFSVHGLPTDELAPGEELEIAVSYTAQSLWEEGSVRVYSDAVIPVHEVLLEGTAIATAIMLFFALCGAWILGYLNISEAAFRIAGGIILFLVALDMLAAKRQKRKRDESTGGGSGGETGADDTESDNLAIYPLAIPLLAGPSAIMSVIVVNAGFTGALASTLTGYAALLAVMAVTGFILCMTVIAEGWMNEKITMVFSRITAIILAGLSVQYVIDGLITIGLVSL